MTDQLNPTRSETLHRAASLVAGWQYGSKKANTILDKHDWAQYWPVVERNERGRFVYTGEICQGEDGYENVDDQAMVYTGDNHVGEDGNNDGWDGYYHGNMG